MDNLTIDSIEAIRKNDTQVDGLHLNYSLFRSKFKMDGRYVFSVEIICNSDLGTDRAFACDITRDHSRAVEIFNLLSTGQVTPCTLNDVLEDIL